MDHFQHKGEGGVLDLTGKGVLVFFYETENPPLWPVNMKLGSNNLYITVNVFYICQQEPP